MEDPFREFLGVKVLECKPGFAKVEGVVREEFTNFLGFAHGGYLVSLADFALGVAANADGVKRFAISIGLDFVSPAEIGDRLIAEAELVGGGRRVSFYEMRILKEERIVAKGRAIVYAKS